MKIKSFFLVFWCLSSSILVSSEVNRTAGDLQLELAERDYFAASKRLMTVIASRAASLEEYQSNLDMVRRRTGEQLRQLEPIKIVVQDGETLAIPSLIAASTTLESLVSNMGDDRVLDLTQISEVIDAKVMNNLNKLTREDVKSLDISITGVEEARNLADLLLVMDHLGIDTKYADKLKFDREKFGELFKDIASDYERVEIIFKFAKLCSIVNLTPRFNWGTGILPLDQNKVLFLGYLLNGQDGLNLVDLHTGNVKNIRSGLYKEVVKLNDSTFFLIASNTTYSRLDFNISDEKVSDYFDYPHSKFTHMLKNSDGNVMLINSDEKEANTKISIQVPDQFGSMEYVLPTALDGIIQKDKEVYIYYTLKNKNLKIYKLEIKKDNSLDSQEIGDFILENDYWRSTSFIGLDDNNLLFSLGKDLIVFNIALNQMKKIDLDLNSFQLLNVDSSHFMVVGKKGIEMVTYKIEDGDIKLDAVESVLSGNLKYLPNFPSDSKYYYAVTEDGKKIIKIPLVPGINCELDQEEKQAAATSADA